MFQLAPKTKKLLALFATADYGTEFSYAEIRAKSDCDLLDTDRQRVYSVIRVLEREHNKTLTNVRGRGYIVTPPNQFVMEGEGRHRRARKQIGLAARTLSAVPIALLDPIETRVLSDQQVFNQRIAQAFANHEERIARLEERLGMQDDLPIEGEATEEAA